MLYYNTFIKYILYSETGGNYYEISARGGALLLGALLLANPPTSALGAEGDAASEQTARELRAELSRLGSSGDPDAREGLLRQIIERCPDTEEAEAAHWALADLCLDGFAEPREEQARSVLEQFLKRYSSSRWATQVRCRHKEFAALSLKFLYLLP